MMNAGQLGGVASPLFFGVTFHEPFVDVDADQRDGLFFEVAGLRNACFAPLTVDHLRCLGGRGDAPHGVKGVHVERQVVELALVVGHRGVDVVVEFDEAVHELPHFAVGGVEDVGAVFVDADAFALLAVSVSARVGPSVDDQRFLTGPCGPVSCDCAEKSGSDDQVIVFRHDAAGLYVNQSGEASKQPAGESSEGEDPPAAGRDFPIPAVGEKRGVEGRKILFAGIASRFYGNMQLLVRFRRRDRFAALLQPDAGCDITPFRGRVRPVGKGRVAGGKRGESAPSACVFWRGRCRGPGSGRAFFVDDDARNVGNVLQQEDFVFPVREPLDEAEPILVDDPFDQQFIDGESQHVVPPQGDDGFRAGLALYVHGRRCQPPVRFAFPVLQDACHGQRMFVHACFDELLQVVCIDPVVGIAEGQVFAPGVFDTALRAVLNPPLGLWTTRIRECSLA